MAKRHSSVPIQYKSAAGLRSNYFSIPHFRKRVLPEILAREWLLVLCEHEDLSNLREASDSLSSFETPVSSPCVGTCSDGSVHEVCESLKTEDYVVMTRLVVVQSRKEPYVFHIPKPTIIGLDFRNTIYMMCE
jgi:hypothetical protein